MHPATSLLTPFIGAKLAKPKPFKIDAKGKITGMARDAINITAFPVAYDADIRRITDEGVEVFHYRDCALIRWDEIDRVEVVAWADDGRSKRTVAEWVRGREMAA
jgi:hypothetical protein